jgi:outer membrane receptor for ferric coprogen and ferric-rhodotorulic acid
VSYRLTDADYRDHFVDVLERAIAAQDPARLQGFRPYQHLEARLHRVSLHGFFNHPSGLLAGGQALWYSQNSEGYAIDRPGDDFWHINLFLGYRFPQRRAEVVLGLLNLTDQDYRLNPLTLYNDLPRERTFMARLQFYF